MKVVIFAGGSGTRLWPLSRDKSPKQFEKLIEDQSTLQLAVDRVNSLVDWKDIYISTSKKYEKLVKKQLPKVPVENIITEPVKKDVGPAVGLMVGFLSKKHPEEPMVILWSDHLVKNKKAFVQEIKAAVKLIKEDPNKIVFIGQPPRYAASNLGWIRLGKVVKTVDGVSFYSFEGFKYKPTQAVATRYFRSGSYCWNLGYFITKPLFVYSLYKKFAPKIYGLVEKITSAKSLSEFKKNIEKFYKDMPEISFDNAILENLNPNAAYVVKEDIGWSDVGTWEALKEALESRREENITRGKVLLKDMTNSLIYNYESDKLIVGVDLDDVAIVNTPDVILVAKKSSSGKLKELVKKLKDTEYKKYL